jgi:ABC-type arginine transport system permease subunit
LYAAVAELYATFTRLPDHPIMPAFKHALPGLLTGWMSILKGHLQVSLFLDASSAPRLC